MGRMLTIFFVLLRFENSSEGEEVSSVCCSASITQQREFSVNMTGSGKLEIEAK